jgi:HK97 family phage major capsid protein
LVAKKLATMTLVSNEVNEDAIISWADQLADESSRALAYKEDDCGFNGDGTSTYGGITGIRQALSDLNGVDEAGGMVLASGNTYSEITLADLHRVVGITPTYARNGAVWVVSPKVNDSVLQKLQTAAGGNVVADVANGGIMNRFLGYPVVLSEVMPTTEANSQICALFGNFSQAASFGDRRQLTMAMSDHATVGSVNVFETDQMAVRVTERFDIVVHDVGTSSAAGPVVCLITASS